MIKLFNKKTQKVQTFKSREDFDYFCDNSSLFGRWDFRPILNKTKPHKKEKIEGFLEIDNLTLELIKQKEFKRGYQKGFKDGKNHIDTEMKKAMAEWHKHEMTGLETKR